MKRSHRAPLVQIRRRRRRRRRRWRRSRCGRWLRLSGRRLILRANRRQKAEGRKQNEYSGYAAAHCGKPLAYRNALCCFQAPRLSLGAALCWICGSVRQSLTAMCCGRAAIEMLTWNTPHADYSAAHFRRVLASAFCSSPNFLRSRSIQPSRSAAAFSSSSLFKSPRRNASKNARVRTL